MHPQWESFINAFKAWDAEAMGRALIALVEDLAGARCSERTRQELAWSCREFLFEDMEGHPRVDLGLDIPELPFRLHLTGDVEWARTGSPRHTKVIVGLHASGARFEPLGLGSERVVLERDDVRTPRPLKGEAGHRWDDPGRPRIHEPSHPPPLPVNHTYRHALPLLGHAPTPMLQGYLAGEHETVWADLMALGAAVRDGPALADAAAVARETMRRCRHNVESITRRLTELGYEFDESDPAWTLPAPDVVDAIARLERNVGPLPLSLCAWYEMVGGVNWIGRLPTSNDDMAPDYPDPLFITPAERALEVDPEHWRRQRYELPLAPDYYHKQDVSGGPPYTVSLPDAGADVKVEYERHDTLFVDYLRDCFRWGGFPGWGMDGSHPADHDFILHLVEGLLPI